MNVALILSGGVGKRLGGNIPKQYLTIKGKMIIEYVIEAVSAASCIDKTVVVAHEPYAGMLKEKFDIDVCLGGEERNITLKNGLDFIHKNYNCAKIMIFDAVRPMVTPAFVNDYMKKLDSYDIVLTAQKITDSLGCYDMHEVRRERYYLLQSPEAYRFDNLYKYFDSKSTLTEVAQQLPASMRTYLNFDFSDNIKITFKHDLFIAEQLLGLNETKARFDVKRLREYLGKNYPVETEQWISDLPQIIEYLKFKWKFEDYSINPNAHFGIVIKADSTQWGKVVVKLIPPFIGRFEGELGLYEKYADTGLMCPLYDYDKSFCALLLKQAVPANYAEFTQENFGKITEFFDRLDKNLLPYNGEKYHDYGAILDGKKDMPALGLDYGKAIDEYVDKAITLYKKTFAKDKLYLLLGDAHKYNLIEDKDGYIAIDPIGYIAPKEIEYARYIGTVLTEDLDNAGENLQKAVGLFSKYSTQEKIIKALFIDVVFRLHNTTFENDDDILARKWLKVIDEILSLNIV